MPKVRSFLLQGIDAQVVEIEVDLDDTQLQREVVVGLPDAAVRESLERVRSAMANTGYPMPPGRTLINLAPADVRKEGPMYDLPIAVGVLSVMGVIHQPARSPSRRAAGTPRQSRQLVGAGAGGGASAGSRGGFVPGAGFGSGFGAEGESGPATPPP
ncbi:MAG: magnesium chelatase domain-containing protein, partial [Phycisphaerales bacterium]